MLRGEAELAEPWAKQMVLGLGLLFLGKQGAVEATVEVRTQHHTEHNFSSFPAVPGLYLHALHTLLHCKETLMGCYVTAADLSLHECIEGVPKLANFRCLIFIK